MGGGAQFFAIVNYRANHELQTIITTNYGLKGLTERMRLTGNDGAICNDVQSRRILSRSCGMCYVVEVGGADYQMQGGVSTHLASCRNFASDGELS